MSRAPSRCLPASLLLNLYDQGGSSPTAAIEKLIVISTSPPVLSPSSPVISYDFGPASAAAIDGFTRVTESTIYSPGTGVGWQQGTVATVDDGTGHFVQTNGATFATDVANGTYSVSLALGDPNAAHTQMQVFVQGPQFGTVNTAAGQTQIASGTAVVTNGELLLTVNDLGAPALRLLSIPSRLRMSAPRRPGREGDPGARRESFYRLMVRSRDMRRLRSSSRAVSARAIRA